jgi:hypothetical protein
MNDNDNPRGPLRTRDDHGRAVVKVPLSGRCGGYATVEADDYDRLIRLGVSPKWYLNDAGGGYLYVKAHAPGASGHLVSVGRIILGAGARWKVEYRSGDRTDLRRSNIRLAKGYAKRHDAAICGPVEEEDEAA